MFMYNPVNIHYPQGIKISHPWLVLEVLDGRRDVFVGGPLLPSPLVLPPSKYSIHTTYKA